MLSYFVSTVGNVSSKIIEWCVNTQKKEESSNACLKTTINDDIW